MTASGPLALDFVSPLPPVRSGIADYSLDLLPHLAERCDLRLIALPGQPLDAELRERFQVVGPEVLGKGGRLPFYQMGNNSHHLEVHRLARRLPGVMTLHDLVLHHFLIERTAKGGDLEGYRRALEENHGWIGDAVARPLTWPGGMGAAAQFALPAHRTLLGAQRGILTHSPWGAEFLGEEMPDLQVRAVPMGIPLPDPPDEAAAKDFRRRYGLPETGVLVGSFGFQTPIKRTAVAVRALAHPALSEVHLLVAGEVSPGVELEALARRAGAMDRVHLTGFLPFDELQTAIAACDLCLNLRYPTAGETSASLLRILAVGRPVLVSDHAQGEDLPQEVVVKVPLGDGETEALVERLGELLANPGALAAMGQRARRHVADHHRLEDAADAMVEACYTWRDAAPQSRVPRPAPPTTIAWSELPGDLAVQGAEAPWPEGERRLLRIRLVSSGSARWLATERGPGGVALELRLQHGGGEESTWLRLPRDLEPGAEQHFTYALRRPLGPARLRVMPHVLGGQGMAAQGGPVWEASI